MSHIIIANKAACFTLINFMVKPHGLLVLVSSTHHCAYTPSLSTKLTNLKSTRKDFVALLENLPKIFAYLKV